MRDQQVVLQFFEQAAIALLGIAARQFVARAVRTEQLVCVAAESGSDAVNRFATTPDDAIRKCLES
jgi:hypothetical protein